MKYDDFLRIYYRSLIEVTKDLIWTPENVFTFEIEPIDEKYLEDGDGGFFGDKILSLGAPSVVYETFFEDYAHKYPDYGYLLLNTQELQIAKDNFQSQEEIIQTIKILVMFYTEAGLFKKEVEA